MNKHFPTTLVALFALSLTTFALADPGELKDQQPKVIVKDVPPAPPLTPHEALETFRLPPGFHLEIVAADPVVQDPICLTFDPDGRMYVVEMRGFMNDPDALDEREPVGRVSLLEDTDGDGKVDRSSVFLDGLVMPRAVSWVNGGVLVAEPPKLWFCRDTDGDGRCDQKTLVFNDYGGTDNPEHTANGLVRMLDNWFYSANWPARIKPGKDGKWLRQPTPARGQWGISQDDVGRIFYNSNSSQLHADVVPSEYTTRNPFHPFTAASKRGTSIAENQKIYPARVNPGTNRSYYAMSPDGKIHDFTAACGPLVYRGDAYPAEFDGNAFVCEPAAHLIKRDRLVQNGISLTAKSVHTDIDFLCSVDERFRPVNLYNAPDGTIYVVDMYHGILQHKKYLTAYLRDQVERRNLAQPTHLGRIYRIVHDSKKPTPAPKLSKATTEQLVQALASPRGWVRDMAQQLLVERNDRAAPAALRKVAADASSGLAALQALWTLQGMERLDPTALQAGMAHKDPAVRAAAVRLSEPLFRAAPQLATRAASLAKDQNVTVRAQLLMSLGTYPSPETDAVVASLLHDAAKDPWLRDAAFTGLAGRELDFLKRFLADQAWADPAPGRAEILNDLAQGVVSGRSAQGAEAVLNLAAAEPEGSWRQVALLEGIADAGVVTKQLVSPRRPVKLLQEPAAFAKLAASTSPAVQKAMATVPDLFTWPDKPGAVVSTVPPLTPAEQARFDEGKVVFTATCAACHQPSGLGMEGLAPPLFDSEWVLGPEQRAARIVLHGLHGPVQVGRRVYEMEMPALNTALTDAQVAAVLTYLRREWGHEASPVAPETVADVRKATEHRQEPWTAEELKKLK